jgi:serine/threonine-protein kinase
VDHTGDAAADAVDDTTRDAKDAGDAQDARRIGYIGKTLGRFSIRAELGRGGMATVYRAHDPQLGRDVAIKVMHGFFAGRADLEARFRREASAVAGIRHPSVLALYDFSPPRGEEPGYLVTELIDGPDLRQVIDAHRGHLLPESAMLFGAQIADALGAVHAAGVVHRDVKPDNVLIDRGEVPRVVLTDFGVAHVGGLDTMTATGAVLGSPAYMSPEQARGDEVGPSSDVFSLGVCLYQMCTGHLPFCGKDPLTMLSAILRGEFTRPGKLDPHVGPALEAIILRCLAHDPAARFANGGAVASALRGMLVGAGLGDEGAALRAFLRDPAEFERSLSPRIADQAREAAERARKQRQGARALAELGRALAYAPQDARAQVLLQQMGSGGRWKRTAGFATSGIAVLGGVGVIVVAVLAIAGTSGLTRARAWFRGGGSPVAGRGVDAPVGAAGAEARPGAGISGGGAGTRPIERGAEHSPKAIGELAEAAAGGKPGGARSPPSRTGSPRVHTGAAGRHKGALGGGSGSGRATRQAEEASPTTADAPGPDGSPLVRRGFVRHEVQVREGQEVEANGAAATGDRGPPGSNVLQAAAKQGVGDGGEGRPATLPAGISLRASHGFCEPSLDDHPPSLRATYAGLEAGLHDVYCTMPQGGPKLLVARYALRAGTRPSLSIVPGPDGKPQLARPE